MKKSITFTWNIGHIFRCTYKYGSRQPTYWYVSTIMAWLNTEGNMHQENDEIVARIIKKLLTDEQIRKIVV